MNKENARAFIMAINSLQPYVPPMLFAQAVNNPVLRTIEQIANADEQPKPHLVQEAGGGG